MKNNFKLLLFTAFIAFLSTSLSQTCGKIKEVQTGSLIRGPGLSDSYPGQWPWLVPLHHKTFGYLCGSSLISKLHLLTAAHCILEPKNPLTHINYYALLGRYNLSDESESHWVLKNISKCFVHYHYDADATAYRSNHDIAVLRMSSKVTFSNFIQPVCMPQSTTITVGVHGFVAGYGNYVPERPHELTPKHGLLNTISDYDCYYKHPKYSEIISKNSFCAGNDDVGPCRGDSGGGFYVPTPGLRVFTVHGIVSQGLDAINCSPEDFAVYVNVAKYVDWIYDKISICNEDHEDCVCVVNNEIVECPDNPSNSETLACESLTACTNGIDGSLKSRNDLNRKTFANDFGEALIIITGAEATYVDPILCSSRASIQCRDGADFYYTKNSSEIVVEQGPEKLFKYEMAHSGFEREASVYDTNRRVFVFAKISHVVEANRAPNDNIELLGHLISVLRNAFTDFSRVVTILDLHGYVEGRISLLEVAQKCQRLDMNIPHLGVLKKFAKTIAKEINGVRSVIKSELKSYIGGITAEIDNQSIRIVKKIIKSSEFSHYFRNYERVEVTCDKLHIDSNLPLSARGKSICIRAKFIEVHGQIIWNLSGKDATAHAKAANETDGRVGMAGNKGGSCEIQCEKFFENSKFLTIKVNGGKGARGQEGGDGNPGKNGIDAELEDFKIDGKHFEIRIENENLRHEWAAQNGDTFNRYLTSVRDTKQTFIFVERTKFDGYGLMLVRGTDGQNGTAGGKGGPGGEGGSAGEVNIVCPQGYNVIVEKKAGQPGAKGFDGRDGLNGRNGRDAYK